MLLQWVPVATDQRDTTTDTISRESMENTLINRSDVIKAADEIEPLPASMSRLLALVASGDYHVAELVEIVGLDPALAGAVLVRANSAMSGSRTAIGDMRQAAARIGANAIVDIALRQTMQSRMSGEIVAYGLGPNELWQHAVTTSVAGDVVRSRSREPIAPMISTAGLVHDIGKLVIAKCVPPSFTDALVTASRNDDLDLAEVEREVLGVDHGEVSGLVARAWGMPVSVQMALTQHHAHDTTDTFTRGLIVADHIAHASVELDAVDPEEEEVERPQLSEMAMKHAAALGMDADRVTNAIVETSETARDVIAGLSN